MRAHLLTRLSVRSLAAAFSLLVVTTVPAAAQDVTPIQQITNTTAGQFPVLLGASVSLDGSRVAFWLAHDQAVSYKDVRLYTAPANGQGPVIQVTPTGLGIRGASYYGAPPGDFADRLVFVACESLSCEGSNLGVPGDVYVVGADGTGLRRLTFDWTQPSQSDGPIYHNPIISRDSATVAVLLRLQEGYSRRDHLILLSADGVSRREVSLPAGFTDVKLLSFSADLSCGRSQFATAATLTANPACTSLPAPTVTAALIAPVRRLSPERRNANGCWAEAQRRVVLATQAGTGSIDSGLWHLFDGEMWPLDGDSGSWTGSHFSN